MLGVSGCIPTGVGGVKTAEECRCKLSSFGLLIEWLESILAATETLDGDI